MLVTPSGTTRAPLHDLPDRTSFATMENDPNVPQFLVTAVALLNTPLPIEATVLDNSIFVIDALSRAPVAIPVIPMGITTVPTQLVLPVTMLSAIVIDPPPEQVTGGAALVTVIV